MTSDTYTLSLHDALPISGAKGKEGAALEPGWLKKKRAAQAAQGVQPTRAAPPAPGEPRRVDPLDDPGLPAIVHRTENIAWRSEEHTSELQSQSNLVCRLL